MAAPTKISIILEAVNKAQAELTRVTKGVQELDKAGKTSAGGVNKSTAAVTGLQTALVALPRLVTAAFSAVAIIHFTRRTLEAVDQLKKFSEEVGFSLQKLAGYQFGAELSNIGSAQFQQGLRTFTGNVAEAADESSRAGQLFQAMGISVRDVNGELRSVESMFEDTADAMSTYADGAAKADLAQQLFGVRSARFINLLNGGKAGLEAYAEEFERLTGVSMEEAARNAEEFNDSLTRMKTVLSGAALQIANQLLPAITEFIRLASEIIRTTGPAFTLIFKGIGFVMKGLVGTAIALNGALENVMITVATLAQASMELLTLNPSGARQLLAGLDVELAANSRKTRERLEELFGLKAQLEAEEGGGNKVPGEELTRFNYLLSELSIVRAAIQNQSLGEDVQGIEKSRLLRVQYLEKEKALLIELQQEWSNTALAQKAADDGLTANEARVAEEQYLSDIRARLSQIDREIRDQAVLSPGSFSTDRSISFERRMVAYNQPTLEGQGGSLGNSLGAGLENFTAGLGNNASKVQQFFGAINSEIKSVASNITEAAFVTGEWGQVWSRMGLTVINTLVEIGIQSLVQHTLRAALRRTETADEVTQAGIRAGVHATSETTKTSVTLGQSISRKAIWLGETVWHGIQAVARATAHVASEIFMTTITLAQSAIRIAAAVVETGKYLIMAAVKAMSAVASIPFVGPILAVAALAAVLAAGAKAMGAFKGGGYTGDGDTSEVAGVVHRKEYVWDAAATAAIGPAMLGQMASAAKAGRPLPTLNPTTAAAVPGYGSSAAASAPSGAGPMNVNFASIHSRASMREFLRQDGLKYIWDESRKRGYRV